MQPSYPYCKYCGFHLNEWDFPKEIIGDTQLPTDNERLFATLLTYARTNIPCLKCGNKKWIRKVGWKV